MTKSISQRCLHAVMVAPLALLLACTASVETQDGAAATKTLVQRLPGGAAAIGWIDFEAARAAVPPEQWTSYEEMLDNDEDYQDFQRFAAATGIDPRTDLKQAAFAVLPGGDDDDGAPVFLLSADMERDRLETTLADVETIEYGGKSLYPMRDAWAALEKATAGDPAQEPVIPEDMNGRPGYLVVLDDSTLAFGVERAIKLAIDVDAGRSDGLDMDPVMNDLVADVAGDSQMWFVASKESWQKQIEGLAAGGPVNPTAVQSIQTVTMSMRMGDGMTMRLAGFTDGPENARLLADSLNGIVSMGKMMMQQEQPELFQILDRGIRITSDEQAIRIEANLTDADLQALRRLAEEQNGSRDQP